MDEVLMLPGFRFHPTDEELVGFYLKRKVQQRPLSIELIKQLDIYKYDPWDLPTDSPPHNKRFMDGCIPLNDSWAICRIFKKTNSSTAQRATSHSWVIPPLSDHQTTSSPSHEMLSQQGLRCNFTSENMSLMTAKSSSTIHFSPSNDLQQSIMTTFSPAYVPSYKPIINPMASKPSPQVSMSNREIPKSDAFSSVIDAISHSYLMGPTMLGDFGKTSESIDVVGGLVGNCNGFSIALPQEMQGNASLGDEEGLMMKDQSGIPFGMPLSIADEWKPNLLWDSSPCPSEMSTSYSTN
ncbi:hypothetical protein U1Q18_016878 [Sarracenia purpurea var. burkii]